MKNELVESGLTGAAIIDRLRRGHMVRRSAWVDNAFIRIVNERGYDENGLAIYEGTTIFTICTDGYIMHFGHSDQPMRSFRAYRSSAVVSVATRDTEGLNMLFAEDWEDWGFIDSEEFMVLRLELKEEVRASIENAKFESIRKFRQLEQEALK